MALTPTSSKTPRSVPDSAQGAVSRRLSGVLALAGTVLLCALAFGLYALNPPHPAAIAPLAAVSVTPAAPPLPAAPRKSDAWADLSDAEREALSPLASEWSKLGAARQRKWLVIADRFPQMTEADRARTQERMREWAKLTPEQRRLARDTYLQARALPPEKRAELLAKYQQLPDDEKEHLTAIGKEHKSVLPIKLHGKPEALPNKDQIREGSVQKVPGLMASPPADLAASPSQKAQPGAIAPAAQTPPAAASAPPPVPTAPLAPPGSPAVAGASPAGAPALAAPAAPAQPAAAVAGNAQAPAAPAPAASAALSSARP